MKRLFIGIPIESQRAVQAEENWKKDPHLNRNVLKWVKPENWHITLIFLGATPGSAVDLLQQLIEESFNGIQGFSSELSGIGVFPNTHNPKVLWLGLENFQFLMTAQSKMRELLQQNGFSLDDKPLKPHLTLARVKNIQHRASFETLLNHYQQSTFGTVEIDCVVLYESISTNEGPVYKPLFVKELE